MKTLSIDIETYSDVPISKTGVYRYCESPDFEILLFGYSVDSGPVQVVDLACGEKIPAEIIVALEDESVIKWAFNATFERICRLRDQMGVPVATLLDTKGPEIRVTRMADAYPDGIPFAAGDRVKVRGTSVQADIPSTREVIYMNVEHIVHDVPVGVTMLIADGEMELLV